MEINTKVIKWDKTKLKTSFTTRNIISKVKSFPSEWGEIIANETTDKGLTSKILSISYNSIPMKRNKTNKKNQKVGKFKKWKKYINRHFSKEDIHRANKHMGKNAQYHSLLQKCK